MKKSLATEIEQADNFVLEIIRACGLPDTASLKEVVAFVGALRKTAAPRRLAVPEHWASYIPEVKELILEQVKTGVENSAARTKEKEQLEARIPEAQKRILDLRSGAALDFDKAQQVAALEVQLAQLFARSEELDREQAKAARHGGVTLADAGPMLTEVCRFYLNELPSFIMEVNRDLRLSGDDFFTTLKFFPIMQVTAGLRDWAIMLNLSSATDANIQRLFQVFDNALAGRPHLLSPVESSESVPQGTEVEAAEANPS